MPKPDPFFLPKRPPMPRNRKPTGLAKIDGTRKSRINTAEPEHPGTVPDPPAYLDKEGRLAYLRVATILVEMGVASGADVDALSMFALNYSDFIQDLKTVRKEGRTVRAGTGASKAHPLIALYREAMRDMMATLGRFGLTPADRAKVFGDTNKRDENPVANWQKKHEQE